MGKYKLDTRTDVYNALRDLIERNEKISLYMQDDWTKRLKNSNFPAMYVLGPRGSSEPYYGIVVSIKRDGMYSLPFTWRESYGGKTFYTLLFDNDLSTKYKRELAVGEYPVHFIKRLKERINRCSGYTDLEMFGIYLMGKIVYPEHVHFESVDAPSESLNRERNGASVIYERDIFGTSIIKCFGNYNIYSTFLGDLPGTNNEREVIDFINMEYYKTLQNKKILDDSSVYTDSIFNINEYTATNLSNNFVRENKDGYFAFKKSKL